MAGGNDPTPSQGSPSRADELRQQIRAAWSHAGAPASPLVDCPCPECTELEQRLRGRDWRSLDSALAESLEQDLPLMGARTFRALLPAFLLAALDPECDVDEFLGYALEPSDFNTPRFEGLDRSQGAAVLGFLQLDLAECEAANPAYADGPRRAILEYWHRFGPDPLDGDQGP